jgi:hypothetical protein
MTTSARDEMQLIGDVIAPGMVGHKASLLVLAKKTVTDGHRRSHLYKKR